MNSKITPKHLERAAYVYIRQSSQDQVRNRQESQRRQYALQDHARQLGWTKVVVIDEDQGRSGSGTARSGFDRLIAAVCEGCVGAVLALEVSHHAHKQQDEEVTIYYRFHPDHGAVVPLRQRVTYQTEELGTVVLPDGRLRKIPTWMTEPRAAGFDLHEPPRFSRRCLKELRHLVDVALSGCNAATTKTVARRRRTT